MNHHVYLYLYLILKQGLFLPIFSSVNRNQEKNHVNRLKLYETE
jgi:hypothetical protein